VDTTAAIMARGLLMLSQKLSPTGLITEDTGKERGLLMPSQKQSPKLSLITGAILLAGPTRLLTTKKYTLTGVKPGLFFRHLKNNSRIFEEK